MVRTAAAAALAATLLLSAGVAVADSSIPSCGPDNPCPADAPCCSQYGQCGVGAYCLGGCDPLFSHTLDSCVPAPVCNNKNYAINGLDGVVSIDKYLGDATKANWVATGNPLRYNDGLLLTMAEGTVGTLLASTHYVWYGKISAKLRTSQGKGVVTAFIMMSDVRDEIDFEWIGTDIGHAQSNYYSQGVTVYTNGKALGVPGDNTVSTEHEYTIDWQPDKLTWSVDGTVLRTLNRQDTWNSTVNRFDYPQTPSRVMLSLWPAGLPSNGQGTIEWAGGLVDWNSPYMQNGYYYAEISEVSVECYDPPSNANKKGSKSYIYTNPAGTNDTVSITNDQVILGDFYATGTKPDKDDSDDDNASKSASASKSSATAKASKRPETVPGMSGAGSRGEDGTVQSVGSGASASGSASSGSSGSSGSGSGATSLDGNDNSFDQGLGGSGKGSGSGSGGQTGGAGGVGVGLGCGVRGVALALGVAVVGLLVLV